MITNFVYIDMYSEPSQLIAEKRIADQSMIQYFKFVFKIQSTVKKNHVQMWLHYSFS